FILARHPFEVGDRIEVGGVIGDVIDIELFKFSLLEVGNWVDADQSTGRIINVPNRMVFNHFVANYTSGIPYIWNEIPITITFESDWKLAKKLLQEVTERHALYPKPEEEAEIRRAAKKSNVRYPRLTPVVYTKVSESGVVLTLRYLCRPRRRRTSEEAIWEEVLLLFAEQKELDFAYTTQRIFYHPIEGKTLLTDHSEVAEPRSHLINESRTQ
ncbi:MAG: mechanosensitive ion channel domain-containing protein, partial [Chloroflexota bacterium]